MVMHVASACRRAEAEGFSTPAQQMRKHRGRASPPRAPNTPRGEWIAICTRGVDLARPPRAAYSMDVACGCFYPFLAMGVACADHKTAVNLHSVTRRMCSRPLETHRPSSPGNGVACLCLRMRCFRVLVVSKARGQAAGRVWRRCRVGKQNVCTE